MDASFQVITRVSPVFSDPKLNTDQNPRVFKVICRVSRCLFAEFEDPDRFYTSTLTEKHDQIVMIPKFFGFVCCSCG